MKKDELILKMKASNSFEPNCKVWEKIKTESVNINKETIIKYEIPARLQISYKTASLVFSLIFVLIIGGIIMKNYNSDMFIFSSSKAGQASEKETNSGGKVSSTAKALMAQAKLTYYAKDLDSLIKDSPLIVVAQATDSQTEQTFQMADFVFTQLNVKSILKDNGLIGDKISLLQTVADFDPTVAKGSTVLLFLYKYEGPIPGSADAYICQGCYQGNYTITGDKIVPSKDNNAKLSADIQKIQGLDELKAKVDAIQSQK